jgi:membrane protein
VAMMNRRVYKMIDLLRRTLWNHLGEGVRTRCREFWHTCQLFFAYNGMFDNEVPMLTFSTLTAIVPFLALLLGVARTLGFDNLVEKWLRETLEAQPLVADTLVTFTNNYLANTRNSYIIGAGIVMMLFTVFSLVKKIERCFNVIWNVKGRNWWRMLRDYTCFVILFLLMAVLSYLLSLLSVILARSVDDISWLSVGLERAVLITPLLLLTLFFIIIYRFIPNTRVTWRCVLMPGCLAGVTLSLMQYLYIRAQVWLTGYNMIYGSFAAIPLFFLWVEYSWSICIFCAQLCYTRKKRTIKEV